MKSQGVTHDTFVIERRYPASPAATFRAFADVRVKQRWFGCVDGWGVLEHTLDFREGGRETWRGGPPGGPVHRNDTVYADIRTDERIIWSYAMAVGDRRISVSLATVEIRPDGTGCHLTFTEQGAFFDGVHDSGDREVGTRALLDALGAELARQVAG